MLRSASRLYDMLDEQAKADAEAYEASTIRSSGSDGPDTASRPTTPLPDTPAGSPAPAAAAGVGFTGDTIHGKLLPVRSNAATSQGGVLTNRFVSKLYEVYVTPETRHLAESVAQHAQAFTDAVLPELKLHRQPNRNRQIRILLLSNRNQYLNTSFRPLACQSWHLSSAGRQQWYRPADHHRHLWH